MAVGHFAIHGERHVNPLVEQRLERQSGTNASGRENAGNGAVTEDTFTPSGENNSTQATAQAAGIFQLSQAAVTANTVLAQPAPNANPNAVPGEAAPATATNADPAQTAGTTNANTSANAAQQIAGAPAAPIATAAATATTDVQGQIQALNTALAALGLSRYDIQQINRIAMVIQNFNPSAYTDLVNQFQELARQVKQFTSPPTAATSGRDASPIGTANANPGANANGGGFQILGISINFIGLQETVNTGAANGGGQRPGSINTQTATANLQIEQVRFTLTNGNGQTVQVQAPQQNPTAATANQQSPKTQILAA